MCRQTCPLGIDPNGFVVAGMTNNPNLYVNAYNIRLRLSEALAKDPHMILRFHDGRKMTAQKAYEVDMAFETEALVVRMRDKDAATYCFLCGNCEKRCPIDLPILTLIKDLKDDGIFNR